MAGWMFSYIGSLAEFSELVLSQRGIARSNISDMELKGD